MDISLELVGWDQISANWQRAPEIFQQELTQWAEETTAHLTQEVVSLTPKDTGLLQGSIKPFEVAVDPLGVSILIGTPLDYAVPVELGSKPHEITPKNGKALHFIFHGVPITVKKVNHPGTKGYFMFHQALDNNKQLIQDSFTATVDRIMVRVASA